MMKKKAIVGMSGGVDSSVAAALLLEMGYDVIGVTIITSPCTLPSINIAKEVANELGIELITIDLQDSFKDKVIDYFVDEYLQGFTPNPCVVCNRLIKFEALLNISHSIGADFVATGHYAKTGYDSIKNRHLLKKASDFKQDQSYMLYNLTQNQLSRTIFPLGEYTKNQVREIGLKYNLTGANRPASQEICFIDNNDYGKFIRESVSTKIQPGCFVDLEGNILGKHKGIIYYTVGQRRGLGKSFGKPMYVVKIDRGENCVVLGDLQDTYSEGLVANSLNFISVPDIACIKQGLGVSVKTRYSAEEVPATIYPFVGSDFSGDGGDEDKNEDHKDREGKRSKHKVEEEKESKKEGRIEIKFESPQKSIAPGQSVVFYDGEIVVGGGVIISSISSTIFSLS